MEGLAIDELQERLVANSIASRSSRSRGLARWPFTAAVTASRGSGLVVKCAGGGSSDLFSEGSSARRGKPDGPGFAPRLRDRNMFDGPPRCSDPGPDCDCSGPISARSTPALIFYWFQLPGGGSLRRQAVPASSSAVLAANARPGPRPPPHPVAGRDRAPGTAQSQFHAARQLVSPRTGPHRRSPFAFQQEVDLLPADTGPFSRGTLSSRHRVR